MHVQTQRLQLCHHTIFLLFLSLSHSIHLLHMFHPSLSLRLPSSLCLHGYPQRKFACKVMKSHRHTPVPAEHTLSSFESESHVHIILTHTLIHLYACTCGSFKTETQTYFPINNACWSYCSQRSRESERMSERRKNPEKDGAHHFTKLKIWICFK